MAEMWDIQMMRLKN